MTDLTGGPLPACAMYHNYFGLGEAPFSLAPDPRYLYMSERHQEALAHLLYGVSGDGGFVLLTGDVGAGKTTICRCLLEQIPAACDVAYLFNPKLTVEELLSSLCTELHIEHPPKGATIKTFVDRINTHLLDAHARGRHTVLIIDEAQNLSADVLEQMRLLTNLETNRRKLLQIILVGQPELAQLLARPDLRQLAQRIVARYHLEPLTKPEIFAYVQHRLEVAGAQRPLIPSSLSARLYRLSHGVPRLINVLCDRALLGAYVQGKERVDRATLAQAAREVFYQPAPWRRRLLRFFSNREAMASTPVEQAPPPVEARPRRALRSGNGARVRKKPANAPASTLTPDIVAWPDTQPRSRSKSLALDTLFAAWGADKKTDLRCERARGGLDELRLLNRPAVLVLRDSKGRNFHATLTALDGEQATVNVGGGVQSIAHHLLVKQWSGDYMTLWRPPPFDQDNIWPGERGVAVEWLRRQLATLQGTAIATADDTLFDDALVAQVKTFQRAHALIPDGAVGLQTLIRLSSVADPAAPTLIPAER